MPEPHTFLIVPGLLCDASMFAPLLAALAPHGTVLVADHGDLDDIGAMARAALALGDGPLIVIGHSMGGRVALEMARLAPERVARLVLMDTGSAPRREGEEAGRQAMVDLAYAEGMAALADRWLPPMLHPDRTADAALVASLRAMVERSTPDRHAAQIRALLGRPDARAHLPSIACPTLALVGRQDRWSPLAQHEEIVAAMPDARLAVIEEAGHMAPAERPGAVAAAILGWLGLAAADAKETAMPSPASAPGGRLPDVPLFDRPRALAGYRMNKMAMALSEPANRDAFRADEGAFLDRYGLSPEEKRAVMARDWREMIRLGGNIFYILKISAIDPIRLTEIGALQLGMDHDTFLRERLGKK